MPASAHNAAPEGFSGRDESGRFAPGASGNPGGRPKGMGKFIRSLVGEDGEQLVRRAYEIAMGTARIRQQKVAPTGELVEYEVAPSFAESTACLVFLRDSGFGKPASSTEVLVSGQVEHTHQAAPPLAGMTDDEKRALVAASRALRAARERGGALPARGELGAQVIEAEVLDSHVLEAEEDDPFVQDA